MIRVRPVILAEDDFGRWSAYERRGQSWRLIASGMRVYHPA